MKQLTIKIALLTVLMMGSLKVLSAPLSTTYIDDYYEHLQERYYTVKSPMRRFSFNTYPIEPSPIRPVLPGPVIPKKPVKPETPPPIQDVPVVNLPKQGTNKGTWPSAYKGTWMLNVQPYNQNSDVLLMMRVFDSAQIDVIAQDGSKQLGVLKNVKKDTYTINTVTMCGCDNTGKSGVAYSIHSYSVSFNRFDELEGKYTAYHYTADGSTVSLESGDVNGTLFNFDASR
ncbi:hypothetical protein [Alteromonas gracilis]|uniref:hypothetical protein n=1 Tax=Alteromonas gracilis TaxID=1479524 RepID=UPI0037369494